MIKYFHIFLLILPSLLFGQKNCDGYFLLSDSTFKVGDKCKLEIYYDLSGGGCFRPECIQLLDSVVLFIKKHPNLIFEIGAHTDFRGPDEFNEKLSEMRARSVVDYFIEMGIDKAVVSYKGYGEKVPAIVCKSESEKYPFLKEGQLLDEAFIKTLGTVEEQEVAHEINRRTEIKIIECKEFDKDGQLFGKVMDLETGEPIPFVNVRITHNDFIYGVMTDFDGVFTISNLEHDEYKLQVSSIPYYPVDTIINFKKISDSLIFKLDRPHDLDSVKICIRKYFYTAWEARSDIKFNNIKIFVSDSLGDVNEKVSNIEFEDKYGVKYCYLESICRDSLDDLNGYNKTVFNYLNEKYGKAWRNEIRKDAIGIRRKIK